MPKLTLQEVMEEIRLTEKKIENAPTMLQNYSAISGTERPTIGYDSKNAEQGFSRQLAMDRIRALYQANLDLIKRLATLKKVRDNANMDTQIIVAGQKMSIYDAIVYKRVLKEHLDRLFASVDAGLRRAEQAQNTTIERRAAAEIKKDPEMQMTVLVDRDRYMTDKTKHEEILSKLESALTVANVQTTIEVPE